MLTSSVHLKSSSFVRPCHVRTQTARRVQGSRTGLTIQARYPDPQFIEQTLQDFEEGKPIANVEEARVLFSKGGYTFLDVRPLLEADMIGRLRGSVQIPYKNAKKRWEDGQMKIDVSDNENFVEELLKKIPNKETKILVCDTNGKKYAIDVLQILEENEYYNTVGLKGGFFAWYRTWDNKLNRRVFQEYTTNDAADGDAMGIHTTGVGFERMDNSGMEAWQMFMDL
eukprot:TRINITY_DN38904_c0_g1_i1.p1 TRINITY_DN38904_c0_g1~~TRINITY_DN38904_c0_g1_i1.p1  ORF type:complete len:250 (+),score=36.24 TRINITY_DN38904_c0_g1_i1:73-750(+)